MNPSNKLNVLAVCQYYVPENFRHHEICEDLVRRGYGVTMLTGLPNYPDGIVPKEYRNNRLREETIEGVKVLRTFEIGRGKGPIRLTLNYLSFLVSGTLKVLTLPQEFDLILVFQYSPITMVLPAAVMKWRSKIPMLLYCYDLWPSSMKNIIHNEKNPIYRIVRDWSGRFYHSANRILVTSKSFIEYLTKTHHIDESIIAHLPQFSFDVFGKMLPTTENEHFDIVYIGNIGIAQKLDSILFAIHDYLFNQNIRLHYIGTGSDMERLRKLTQQLDLNEKVIFHGWKKKEELREYFELADILYLSLVDEDGVGGTVPLKLIDYLSSGKAILASAGQGVKAIMETAGCGVFVAIGNHQSLADAIVHMKTSVDMLTKWGKNGRRFYLENHGRLQVMNQLVQELENIHKGDFHVR